MNFKIHRGTQEIGGSCVEVWTDETRIVIDIGMPLVEKDGSEFDFGKYHHFQTDELVRKGILPDIKGFYQNEQLGIDGILLSHAHVDHYGFGRYLHPDICYYLGAPTHKLINLTCLFTPQQNNIKNWTYFEKSKAFFIGNIKITPFWMDHSAFDAYAFLLEAEGKSIFYSGDFRGHGRKSGAFKWFTHNAPQSVDYLLLEGTQIERNAHKDKTEREIENELIAIFSEKGKINLVYSSGQNIDRLVSVYKACKQTGKTFAIDVYIACILKELSNYASIPYPSRNFKEVRVFFPHYLCNRISSQNDANLLYQFQSFKITKEQISEEKGNVVMLVRSSMKFDLDHIKGIEGGNIIYSMWEGYLRQESTKIFLEYLKGRQFKIMKIHTSGHADIETLSQMADAIKPKKIVPIHTFRGNEYQKHFNYQIAQVKDGETVTI
ncbi:MAG: MBL fold metallo-hydrolase [Deltaproteobacteria bacterium CG12_big_fil_rev_8_21_14_0_65_43_10]|nr:MAG: MBL fold metallo-hydrolase [Deltaproteobacteria bacterium CG2_30_43_15]PIQ45377.1 MAG: MBL fold metallo-hydrolase [Deltaproteobacteria bacterium CG12_big_fil_rev_8_21_14_0_65_43_10]PIU85519.1 MAG: MBL fold metallo-hydrolase [Deltaproteobacteria bacterium CG06_land_8_20_14_3_00_44_19]PIX25513.1 MAG: MBL fold metallo-hydrolase [Deltaproteobacteria bacterium CG_4_8_14_3_um_filter_43_13]PIZ19370.1 MAG: MBL fold metallo-hydrolase [Deltaproteobacteria bacterium CG_4_10_14_0_8_um_filter_43_12]